MKPLRMAVVGTGHLGRIHGRLLSARDDVELVAVVDPLPAAREDAARQFGAAPYADHRHVVHKIDAAVLATPTESHCALGSDLLRSGVHLLVEKPIALKVPEADELVGLAREQNLVLQVGHVERFNPAVAAARPYVAEPKYIEAVRASGYTFRSIDVGVVLDLMIHDLDLVLSLTRSEVVEVQALGMAVLGPCEDLAQARLVFANGCVANLCASRVSLDVRRAMQLYTPTSYAAIDFAAGSVKLVRPSREVLERRVNVHELAAAGIEQATQRVCDECLPVQDLPVPSANAIQDEHCDFVSAIHTGRPVQVPGEQARDALAVAEWILTEISGHRWNGARPGPLGPLALPTPAPLAGPHWPVPAPSPSVPRRKAG